MKPDKLKKPTYKDLEERIRDLEKESLEFRRAEKELLEKQKTLEEQNISIVQKSIELSDIKRQLEDRNYDLETAKNNTEKLMQDLKTNEKKLRESRDLAESANESKSEFLANMSHEIRTPLNSILGFSSILLEDEDDLEKIKILEIINKAGESLLNLINDILDFTKVEAGKIELLYEPFSPHELFEHIKNIFSFDINKNIDFTVEADESMPELLTGDEFRIKQIAMNLLSNSFKFTKSGRITLKACFKNNEFIFSVEDTGIGIPEEKQEEIFSVFSQVDSSTTRKYGGTGLGLSITRELVRQMNGEIKLKSSAGKGTQFEIILPLEQLSSNEMLHNRGRLRKENKDNIDINQKPEIRRKKIFRVLVAEDNELNRKLVGKLLDKLLIDYEFANNGQIVIDKLEKGKRYNLLLLDIQMPVMDGFETIKYIRKMKKFDNLYVIALTGKALKGDAEKYLSLGCNDYVFKPIDIFEFNKKISRRIEAERHI